MISIGIPFHNCEKTLADAIRSVFAQTYQEWELILVDDGSTDGSLEVAKQVRDPRVRVVSDTNNRGLPYRLNQIARLADGELLARMDGDDIMHPERLAKQIELMHLNPNFDVVGSGIYTIDAENRPVSVRGLEHLDVNPSSVISNGLLLHPTVLGRREWFLRNKYDESFRGSEDYELWCRTYSCSTFGKLSIPLHFYRENSRSPQSYLRHYLKAAHYQRKIYRMYGSLMVGKRRSRKLIFNSYIKGEIYRIATLAGMQKFIVDKRSQPMSRFQLESANKALTVVLNTKVPGLD